MAGVWAARVEITLRRSNLRHQESMLTSTPMLIHNKQILRWFPHMHACMEQGSGTCVCLKIACPRAADSCMFLAAPNRNACVPSRRSQLAIQKVCSCFVQRSEGGFRVNFNFAMPCAAGIVLLLARSLCGTSRPNEGPSLGAVGSKCTTTVV